VDRHSLGDTVGALAAYGYVVAVADYAFASSTPGTRIWPVDFQDVQDAVRWLRENSDRYGIDPNRIAAWGESAGGNLASLLGTFPGDAGGSASSGKVSAQVQAVVDFYGPADLTNLYNQDPRDRAYLDTFLGGSPTDMPGDYTAASPITYVASNDPPFFILQGTADKANLFSQSAELANAFKAAGVPYHLEVFNNVPHGFRLRLGHNLNLLPQVLTFLDNALNHHNAGV
jgi:acetyl esterase/lipase